MARAKMLLQEIETYAQTIGDATYAQTIGDATRDPLLILDRGLCVKPANRASY